MKERKKFDVEAFLKRENERIEKEEKLEKCKQKIVNLFCDEKLTISESKKILGEIEKNIGWFANSVTLDPRFFQE